MTERSILENGLEILVPGHTPDAVEKLLIFSEFLIEKNRHMNLTAVSSPENIVTRHFLDSAFLCQYVNGTVIDVGTGAGFPGIPLSILCPDTNFVLLDSQRKRIEFLNKAISKLDLKNCETVHARAEDYAKDHREEFHFAVSRAVAELKVLCELCIPLVRKDGGFLAMKAENCKEEVSAASNAISLLGGKEPKLINYKVPFGNIKRVLVDIRKAHETPQSYPRRYKKISTMPL